MITDKTKFLIPLMLLSLTLLFCLTTVSAASGDTVYVSGSGNDSWDGQSAVYNSTGSGPKLSIKNATGTVNQGGTIHIANGQYTGENNTNITIDKNMSIIGESQTGTIVDGANTAQIFHILPGLNVTICNLTLTNGNNTSGGAVENYGNLTVNNCIFTGNTAGWDNANNGGAINNQGNLAVNSSIFNNNTARIGGAIYNYPNFTLNVNNSIFINNTGKIGGGIANYGSSIVKGSTFTNNTAQRGGAIFNLNYDLLLNVENCIFINNNVTLGGGAVYNNDGNVTVKGSIFTGNTATGTYGGGAVYNEGLLNVIGCTFTGNTATGTYGGAIHNWSILTLDDCNFTSNNATLGGAIFNEGTCNLTGSTFTGNNASFGGAIFNDGTCNLTDSTFTGNSVSLGGAIFNDGTCNLTGSTFTDNIADYGGVIYNSGTITSLSGCNFTSNTATNYGGAICNFYAAINNLSGCNFINNNATYGGAIYNIGGLTANYNRFYNNTATTEGNAIYCSGGSVYADYNWWGSNLDPKTISNLIYEDGGSANVTYWVILSVNATPNIINNTQNATVTADLNHYTNSTGYVGELSTHIPDGSVTLDIPWGSFTRSGITHSITLNTLKGVATATFYAKERAVNASYNPVKVTALADGYTTNDAESAYITINKTAKLYIKTTSSNNNPKMGEKFLLTYKLGNKGPDEAKNVTITFQLPKGLDFVNIKVDAGKCIYNPTTRTVTWTLNSVPVGDPYLYLTVKAAGDGTYKIIPNITSTTYDPNSRDSGVITINVQSNNNSGNGTSGSIVNAAGKTTIGLQDTGLPLNYLLLAVLMVLSGLVPKRK